MKITKEVIEQSGIKFGTSGARGLVSDFTEEVCTAFAISFLDTMKNRFNFKRVCVAMDNRPSSPSISTFICGVIESYGLDVDFYGVVPTPALALQAMKDKNPSIMITGSHIPYDRNGIKFYTPVGEISKEDEIEIINNSKKIKLAKSNLPKINDTASINYMNRYANFFGDKCLNGLKIGIYEHSSAGRDLYSNLFKTLGAQVISLDRSDEFVPIDTEAVSDIDKKRAKDWSKKYSFDLIFSTDGDGDRPLIADEKGEWLRGDIVGLLTSQFLEIEALAVPVSCNTAIEKSNLFKKTLRTKIGSPYVIEAFENLKDYNSFAGFEANGGYLLGTKLKKDGNSLDELPTRDALLPFIVLTSIIVKNKTTLSKLVDKLPQRFTSSNRLQEFSRVDSLNLIKKASSNPKTLLKQFRIEEEVLDINETDGLRLTLDNNIIIHLRASGNAPELRCYVETYSQELSDILVIQILSSLKS